MFLLPSTEPTIKGTKKPSLRDAAGMRTILCETLRSVPLSILSAPLPLSLAVVQQYYNDHRASTILAVFYCHPVEKSWNFLWVLTLSTAARTIQHTYITRTTGV